MEEDKKILLVINQGYTRDLAQGECQKGEPVHCFPTTKEHLSLLYICLSLCALF